MANSNDTFTEAVDTVLESHTSDSGHTWSKTQGNQLTVLASGDYIYNAAPSNTSRYSISVTPASAEYDVQATITASGDGPGPSGRIVAAGPDEYGVYFQAGDWVLYKLVAGTPTTLGTYTGSAPTSAKVIKLELRNAAKKVFIDGVERISSADNALTTTGNPGINFRGVVGEQLDAFSSTDAGGGGGSFKASFSSGSNSLL